MAWWLWCAAAFIAVALLEKLVRKLLAPGFKVHKKHVFITGGSSGLGLAVAVKCAQAGALVTIAARNESKLIAARRTILEAAPEAQVVTASCDVSDEQAVNKAVSHAVQAHGRDVDMAICCAGLSATGRFHGTDLKTHRAQMDLNYFGCLNVIHAVLPAMRSRGDGHLVLVSSAVCFCSIVGYSAYAPSKFALRGLADSLRNELKADGIKVTSFFPSNLDTPGFEEENKTKPPETTEIEGSVNIVKPEQAADDLINGIAAGQYAITNELLSELGRISTRGTTPANWLAMEVFMGPFVQIIASGFAVFSDYVVKSHAAKRAKAK